MQIIKETKKLYKYIQNINKSTKLRMPIKVHSMHHSGSDTWRMGLDIC